MNYLNINILPWYFKKKGRDIGISFIQFVIVNQGLISTEVD